MGSRETIIPLTRIVVCVVVVFRALALPLGASAQIPTDLSRCMPPSSPTCFALGGHTTYSFCGTDPPTVGIFLQFFGPVAWYPLRCVGPITVAVQTYAGDDTRFPLYVEVVPLPAVDWGYVCENIPGTLILTVYGQSHVSARCGTWDEAGPIDITGVIPLGSLYALRLYFLSNLSGFSPFVSCIRVTAHPVDTPVLPTTWGRVKALYK